MMSTSGRQWIMVTKRVIKDALRPSRIRLGCYSLRVPRGHRLAEYRKRFPQYGRFPAAICRAGNRNGLIIDIGANIGQSALQMAQFTENPILAVEPEPGYYEHLSLNVETNGLGDQITTVECAISSDVRPLVLETSRGTSRTKPALSSAEAIIPKTLAGLLCDQRFKDQSICLIKVDTDGYDFIILSGALPIIEKHRPMLFWENGVRTSDEHKQSMQLLQSLSGLDYRFACFDNFGTLISRQCNLSTISHLNDYLLNQVKASERRVPYLDIFAWVPADESQALAAIRDHVNETV